MKPMGEAGGAISTLLNGTMTSFVGEGPLKHPSAMTADQDTTVLVISCLKALEHLTFFPCRLGFAQGLLQRTVLRRQSGRSATLELPLHRSSGYW